MKSRTGLIFIVIGILIAGSPDVLAQTSKSKTRKVEKNMAGKKRKAPRDVKIKQPKAVTKAQRTQQKKQDRREKDYDKAIKQNKERHYSIQSPDVKARMKQNELDIKMRDKERKKAERKKNRKKGSAKKKYKGR